MDSGMIGKIEKAKRYAQQPERFQLEAFTVTVSGENNPHVVTYNHGEWHCDCDFFQTRGRCSHTIALEMIFKSHLPTQPVEK